MTKLSVNINKIATLRNARQGNVPNVIQMALDAERFGAQGITVHPRPDERHIRYADVRELRPRLTTEFNIEGNPTPAFVDLVCEVIPTQVTLVPDAPDAITSNAGWDTITHADFLRSVIARFHTLGIRVSIFVDPVAAMIHGAAACGSDRVELYTEAFATAYAAATFSSCATCAVSAVPTVSTVPAVESAAAQQSVAPYAQAAALAGKLGLGVNAGHDLSRENLHFFASRVTPLDEVSIGHALIADALYLGLENTIQIYRRCLEI
ncbi:MAG: pyridoxine 5'-phosphate synthase [Mucinivorans sp.]